MGIETLAKPTLAYEHVLAIGTTGMLKAATLTLARESLSLTAVARTNGSLESLKRAASAPATIRTAQLDYGQTDALSHALKEAIQRAGPVDLVLAWIHSDAPQALSTVISLVSQHPVRFFHVLGSAAADPAEKADQSKPSLPRAVSYHQVILGFKHGKGYSRWLTHEEISGGVLEAIKAAQNQFVVGTVRPWSARP